MSTTAAHPHARRPLDRRDTARVLLQTEIDKLPPDEREVVERFVARRRVARNIGREYPASLTLGQRVADRVARVGGSWRFIIAFAVFLVAWMALNSAMGRAFDPYPFILLNLVLSCLAALQAPVIMMSQNRQAAKDRADMGNDYQVNLKAEIGIMSLHEKIDRILAERVDLLLQQQQALHAAVHAAVPPPPAAPGREL